MNFISRTEQLRRYAAENQKQTRKRLVQPVPPDPFSRTKPRRHRQDSDTLDVDLEELLGVEVLGDGGSEQCQRVQQLNRSWQDRRPANISSLQQYEAYQEADEQLKQLQSSMQLMEGRIATALQRHWCCSVLPADACITVGSSRSVAYHALGTSFWMAVPTVTCRGCDATWEVCPAHIGCWGNTPVSPTHWFDKQLLTLYRELLLGAGLSTHAYADASNAACAVINASARSACTDLSRGVDWTPLQARTNSNVPIHMKNSCRSCLKVRF